MSKLEFVLAAVISPESIFPLNEKKYFDLHLTAVFDKLTSVSRSVSLLIPLDDTVISDTFSPVQVKFFRSSWMSKPETCVATCTFGRGIVNEDSSWFNNERQ